MPVIHVRVRPRSSRNAVVRLEGDVWWIRLTAPPVEGKANAALLEYLSDILGVAQSRLSLEKGHTGRQKSVSVEGLDEEQVRERMQGELG